MNKATAPPPVATKIDLGKLHRADYVAPKKPVLLTLEPARYLAIEGQGAPGDIAFTTRIGALYALAYAVKMTRRFSGQTDYTVSRLEARYWADAEAPCFADLPKDRWRWQLLIRTPDFVTPEELTRAVAALAEKGKAPEASEVRLETLDEGRCVQMLHMGPYDRTGDTVATMVALAEREGLEFHGRHHEIYISDPRRVEPARLKTILRHPVTSRCDKTSTP
jgi:hypothetical protein